MSELKRALAACTRADHATETALGRTLLLLLTTALVVTGTASGATAGPDTTTHAPAETSTDEVAERPDIQYGSAVNAAGDREKLMLDLFLPPGSDKGRPAVVLIHGGGFRMGTRKKPAIRQLAQALARRGYVTVSIDYRLRWAPKGRRMMTSRAARQAQHDAQAAVRFLRRYSFRYGVDRRRIVTMGASSGGITALRVAFNPGDAGRSGNGGYASKVQAAISLWGGAAPRSIERNRPPILVFHGTADPALHWTFSRDACRTTRSHGNACRSEWWRGEGHGPWHRIPEILRKSRFFLHHRIPGGSAPSAVPAGNLLSSPSFEDKHSFHVRTWGRKHRRLLTWGGRAPRGRHVLLVAARNHRGHSIRTQPVTGSSVRGTTYTSRVWLRNHGRYGPGRRLGLRIREITPDGTVLTGELLRVAVRRFWKRGRAVTYTAQHSGSDIQLQIVDPPVGSAKRAYVADVAFLTAS